MSDIGENLTAYLKTKSAVTDLVGSGVAARIYPDQPKQGTKLPYIVYEVFQGTSSEHLTGIAGTASNRVEVSCFASTRNAAFQLAEKVRLAPLQMHRGEFGDTFANNVNSDTSYEQGRDRPVKGGNQRRHWCIRDYIITYQEPTS